MNILKMEKEIENYGTVIRSLGEEQRALLKDTIYCLRQFGVSSYAERLIDRDGNSLKICNCSKWKQLEEDKCFFRDFREHASSELLINLKLNNKIITRSSDKIQHSFLRRLEKEGLNSSVIIVEAHKQLITISYFMVDSTQPQQRDMILNNLKTIESTRKKIQALFVDLFLSNKIKKNKKPFLSKNFLESIVKKPTNNVGTTFSNKIAATLTTREAQCLEILKNGASNKLIAKSLNISIETVKFHLKNIKQKTGISLRSCLAYLI